MVCENPLALQWGVRLRLNPCFNGIWSARSIELLVQSMGMIVLILVLMEYGLRDRCEDIGWNKGRLNPCFNGIWSARVKSVKICMWALYDRKNRRTLKFWGKICTSECKYTKVFWIDCTTCHLYLTILRFLGFFHPLKPCIFLGDLPISVSRREYCACG